MVLRTPPSVSIGAVLMQGKPTVTFPSKPYRRVVYLVDMQNGIRGPVAGYKGVPGGAFTRVFGAQIGANQQWTTPFNLPAGQNFFVQWVNTPTDLSTARATISWKEDT